MNIFVLDKNIKTAAKFHCDKHIVKMPTETAQMISIIQRMKSNKNLPDFIMNINRSHINHPCTKWVGESLDNFIWACNFGLALYDEYQFRYNKTDKHVRAKNIFEWSLNNLPDLPRVGLTPFAKAFKNYPDIMSINDTIKAYRTYYIVDKYKFATWKSRKKPEWFKTLN